MSSLYWIRALELILNLVLHATDWDAITVIIGPSRSWSKVCHLFQTSFLLKRKSQWKNIFHSISNVLDGWHLKYSYVLQHSQPSESKHGARVTIHKNQNAQNNVKNNLWHVWKCKNKETCHSQHEILILIIIFVADTGLFQIHRLFHWLLCKYSFSLTSQTIHWLFTELEKNIFSLSFPWPLATLWVSLWSHHSEILQASRRAAAEVPVKFQSDWNLKLWNFFNWKITCAGPLGHEHSDITI